MRAVKSVKRGVIDGTAMYAGESCLVNQPGSHLSTLPAATLMLIPGWQHVRGRHWYKRRVKER